MSPTSAYESVQPFHRFHAALADPSGAATCVAGGGHRLHLRVAVDILCWKSAFTVLANVTSSYVKDAADAMRALRNEVRRGTPRYSPVASSRTRRSSHHEAIDECSKPQRSKSKAQKREKPDAKRRSLRAAPAEGTSEPAKGAEVWSSPFGERPPFDLGTRIEAYEDVDESGRYRRRGGPRKVKVDRHKQEELNQQWADSLRE
ncbi:hypothetical protein QR680_009692 [Steinernema hermaphroditum]|uniref:Uncharacterized protein n=1 Tax=Steinernema hermaphroditum TaxID=289476 RepID=A0AA39MA78_9BILA|nr:hypothetical protein QR680_009692 [Steinernema hermaphroditum]